MSMIGIILSISGGILIFTIVLLIKYKFKNNSFNHIEAMYFLEKTEIIIDRFTAHRMKFMAVENRKLYRNTELIYNYKTDKYILVIHYFSEEHKNETLKRINLTLPEKTERLQLQ